MIYSVRVWALPLLVLAGCSTMPSEPPDEVTVVPGQDVIVAALPPQRMVVNRVPAPVQAPAPARFAAPAPGVAANHYNAQETWVPLEDWSELNGFGAPRRLTGDAFPMYSFASSNGTMAVKIGSQLAYWNGLEYRLGFAPLMIDGRPYVHSLDVRKNFAPLAADPIRWKTGSVIVIDPGHGGTDVGAASVFDGHFEKEYTLDCARRLEALLAGHGWTVLLTRTNDVNVPLSSRVAFAEEHKADLFLSLHFNSAFPDRQQAGLPRLEQARDPHAPQIASRGARAARQGSRRARGTRRPRLSRFSRCEICGIRTLPQGSASLGTRRLLARLLIFARL